MSHAISHHVVTLSFIECFRLGLEKESHWKVSVVEFKEGYSELQKC